MKDEKRLLERITFDPTVMTGKPTVRGLRITVEQILKALAAGISQEELFDEYPELEKEDVQASLLYAAQTISNEQVYELGAAS